MSNYAAPHQIADAIESLEWKGCSIGHKVILANAVAALRATPPAAAHGDEAVRKDADDLLEPWDVLEALADGYERGYQDGQSKPKGYVDKLTKHRVAADLLAAMRAQAGEGGE